MEATEPQEFQPVRMRASGEQFGRTLANPFRFFATLELAMVQEESQQVQITLAQLASQEEVGPQAAVEVFNEGTGSGGMIHGFSYGVLSGLELSAQKCF